MSADIVNLRQYRKQKARDAKDARAAENRVRHGLKDSEKTRQARERARDDKRWSGNRRDENDPEEPAE